MLAFGLWLATVGVLVASIIGLSADLCGQEVDPWRYVPVGLFAAAATFAAVRAWPLAALGYAALAGAMVALVVFIFLISNSSSYGCVF